MIHLAYYYQSVAGASLNMLNGVKIVHYNTKFLYEYLNYGE